MRQLILLVFWAGLLTGCGRKDTTHLSSPDISSYESRQLDVQPNKNTEISRASSDIVQLTENEFELLVAVVCRFNGSGQTAGGLGNSYITTTPSAEWTARGGWKRLPASFHERINVNGRKFQPSTEVFLVDGKLTDPSAFGMKVPPMLTILQIIDWVSETEAVVKETNWGGPLFGGGSTMTFHNVDGNWVLKDTTNMWVS